MSDNQVYGVIYKIENKVNGKVYIGKTSKSNGFNDRYASKGTGIERVYNFYLSHVKYGEYVNSHLFSAIKKYGFDSFNVEESFDKAYSLTELNEKEKHWISKYNSTDKKYGYNKTAGGDGFVDGKSSYLSKLGKSRKPLICLDTNEVFLTIVDASKKLGICGETVRNVCLGNFKHAYSKIHKKYLKFEYIEEEVNARKPIICITTKERFKSAKEAGQYFNINMYYIVKNCEKQTKSAGKHPITKERLIWQYQLDYELDNIHMAV